MRGVSMEALIAERSFSGTLFLLLKGRLPEARETGLLDAVLVASVDNGLAPPTSFVPRVVASAGNRPHVAMAAGMLAAGERHAGAGEGAALLLASPQSPAEIVREFEGKRIPGFGHRIYKQEDPRAAALHAKARELGFSCTFFQKAYSIQDELEQRKGKLLPLNVDGAVAAALLELGMDARLGETLFLLGRAAGMAAHVLEEQEQGNPYYRLEEDDISYE